MSKFYARITQSARRTVPTARGHNGVTVWAQSWQGSVRVVMGEKDGRAYYEVSLHEGSGGQLVRYLVKGFADDAGHGALGRALDAARAQYEHDRALPDA